MMQEFTHKISIVISCFLTVLLIASWSDKLTAQTIYNMQNLLVDDCEGVLLHSEAGENGNYDHNEDFTFTVCVQGANEIIIAFDYFASEVNYDVMTIYDGPNTNAPVIATLSGVLLPPPTYVATSGCVTFRFRSDDNITANGWRIRWSTLINVPETPTLSVISTIECPLDGANFRFSAPIACDQLVPGSFRLLGPGGSSISGLNILDCNNGFATTFSLTFSPSLGISGNYRLIFEGVIIDACGEEHPITTNVLFTVSNCPISLSIRLPNGPACAGLCAVMEAVAIGDNSQNFTYQWSPTGGNSPAISVCSNVAATYFVTVTDPSSGRTAIASFDYTPLPNPEILNRIQDTVCASSGNRTLQVNITGGDFFSGSIPDNHRKSGVYEFWRWSNGANMHIDTVTYIAPNGCRVRDTVHILPINAGSVQAACLDANPFQMNGGTPAGGAWSGPHVSPEGIFTPSQNGSFRVFYDAPNGCRAGKWVHVGDSIVMPSVDTICTAEVFFLEATPPGGRWSGPGIVNNVNGRLEAWRANYNQWNTYRYVMNGCEKTMQIYINELSAGPDITMCVGSTTLSLPYLGNWSGPGVYDPIDNSFDISALGPGDYRYTLTQNSCSDDFSLFLREVRLEEETPLFFCLLNDDIPLQGRLRQSPDGGVYSGTGISQSGNNWFFNPEVAGSGFHWIYYEAIGCRDSIQVEVAFPAVFPAFEFCERSPPTVLTATPSGGSWSGPGFLDEGTGLFDPQQVGNGTYEVFYHAPTGCTTAVEVEVALYEQVTISGFQQQYCYRDQVYTLTLFPAGGRFLINGIEVAPIINPAQLGTGTHEIYYTKGSGPCTSFDRKFIQVLPPIEFVVSSAFDSICPGQQTSIFYQAEGGSGQLAYNWDNQLGFGNSHIVRPIVDTWYRITVSDQCSQPLMDSVFVRVHPSFSITATSGPPVCFGEQTYAEINLDPGLYDIKWLSNPPVSGVRLTGNPGFYRVEVVERSTGCIASEVIILPGAEPLSANFSLIPNQECIDIIDNEIELIDLSFGFSEGWIDFGDGAGFDMTQPGSIKHEYSDTGTYVIRQIITNELGCEASFSRVLCVKNAVRLFVPDAFSPNGNGYNDEMELFGIGIKDVSWKIYNRYGALYFQADNIQDKWDGNFNGRAAEPGVYVIVVEYTDAGTEEKLIFSSELNLLK